MEPDDRTFGQVTQRALSYLDEDELYDLENDPLEMQNLAQRSEHRARVERMMTKMWSFIRRSGDRILLETHYMPLRLAAVGPEKKE